MIRIRPSNFLPGKQNLAYQPSKALPEHNLPSLKKTLTS